MTQLFFHLNFYLQNLEMTIKKKITDNLITYNGKPLSPTKSLLIRKPLLTVWYISLKDFFNAYIIF